MPSKNKPLHAYYQKKIRCKITFPCPLCHETMSSRLFDKHCETRHEINPALKCVWCQGEHSWPASTKYQHVNHLLACWQSFVDKCTEPLESPPPPRGHFVLDDSEPMCPARHLFGRSKISNLPPLAYELLWPVDLNPLPFPFQDGNLNSALACVRQYLELHAHFEFFHCMVRAVAFPSFLRAMEADRGQSRLLPFSCWCDGGEEREARHKHHRHMIVVSPTPGRFHKEVWRKITLPAKDRPAKHFKCILKKPILSAMHLVNTMGYLSKRESRCNGTFVKRRHATGLRKTNHFWIFTPLPKSFRLPAVLQWDGGIMKLIHQEYRYLKPEILARAPIEQTNGRWQIKVKDLPGVQLYIVLLVSKEFKPTDRGRPTEHVLHLNSGQKIYFEKDNSLSALDDQSWGRVQAELGNLFYAAVGDELFYPTPYQQRFLNGLQSFRVENARLKEALEKKDADIERLRTTYENETARLRQHARRSQQELAQEKDAEIQTLKEKLKQKDAENKTLKEILKRTEDDSTRLLQNGRRIVRMQDIIDVNGRITRRTKVETVGRSSAEADETYEMSLKRRIEQLETEIARSKKPKVCVHCQT